MINLDYEYQHRNVRRGRQRSYFFCRRLRRTGSPRAKGNLLDRG